VVLVSNLVVEHMEVPDKVVSMAMDMVASKEVGKVVLVGSMVVVVVNKGVGMVVGKEAGMVVE